MRPIGRQLTGPYGVTLVISLLCAALYFSGLETQLAYRRHAILDGELWRLVTGNLLHTNQWHLLMNLAGLWVILLLHRQHYSTKAFSALFTILCLLQGLGLLLFYPSLQGYVGLSGMLHGLFAFGAYMDIRQGMKSGYLLLLGVLVKVTYEQTFGASSEVAQIIGARVATEAHLIGVVSGIICLLGLGYYRRKKQA